jgi:hypothetical protein
MFRGLLVSHFKADTAAFVGQDKSEWMTKNQFISRVSDQDKQIRT